MGIAKNNEKVGGRLPMDPPNVSWMTIECVRVAKVVVVVVGAATS